MRKGKRIVERMCCACRRRSPKEELIRVVAREGGVEVDEEGNAPGRGAYLHRQEGCSSRSPERAAIERALQLSQGSISDDGWHRVIAARSPREKRKEGQVSRVGIRLRLRGGS